MMRKLANDLNLNFVEKDDIFEIKGRINNNSILMV